MKTSEKYLRSRHSRRGRIALGGSRSFVHLTPNGSAVFLFTDQGDLIRAHLTPAGYEEVGRTHLIDPTSPLFEN